MRNLRVLLTDDEGTVIQRWSLDEEVANAMDASKQALPDEPPFNQHEALLYAENDILEDLRAALKRERKP